MLVVEAVLLKMALPVLVVPVVAAMLPRPELVKPVIQIPAAVAVEAAARPATMAATAVRVS